MSNLIIEYTQNRIDLRNINKEIAGFDIDLCEYHEAYYETADYASSVEWAGWVVALQKIKGFTPDEMRLAVLLDKRKKTIKAGGDIKRAICAEGRRLLREQAKLTA